MAISELEVQLLYSYFNPDKDKLLGLTQYGNLKDYLSFELRHITSEQVNILVETCKSKKKVKNKNNSILLWLMDICFDDDYNFDQRMKSLTIGEGPDIDTDFCPYQVDNLIKALQKKYGYDQVIRVSAYKPWSLKTGIKTLGKLLKKDPDNYYSISDVEKIAGLIPESVRGKYLTFKELKNDPEFTGLMKKYQDIFNLCGPVDGNQKEVSVHASAVIIGTEKIDDLVPIRKTKTEGAEWFNITQWEGPFLEKMGYTKFDILRTDVLTINDLTCKRIGKTYEWLTEEVPTDDPKVFDLINNGYTAGLFQMEETYLLKLVSDLKPKTVEDLAIFSALNRPGPRDSGLLNDYIKFKKTGIKQNRLHPILDPILDATGGVLIYQEQVMACCQLLAGISLVEADKIRKAMGKKDAELMKKYEDIFVKGCFNYHKLDEAVSKRIWGVIAGFAEYGFNKSHALAYAYNTYFNAYLKTYYTTDFMLTLMTVRADRPKKLVRYINEYRKMGYTILPPDVNYSDIGFSKKDDQTILFGLGMVHGIGDKAATAIIKNREAGGKFSDFKDFLVRLHGSKINSGNISILIKVGAFDSFNFERESLLTKVEDCLDYFRKKIDRQEKIEKVTIRDQEILDYPVILEKWTTNCKLGLITSFVDSDGKKQYSEPRPKKPIKLSLPDVPVFPDLTECFKDISRQSKVPWSYIKWEAEYCHFAISRNPLSFITKAPGGIVFNQIADIEESDCKEGSLLVAVTNMEVKQIKSGPSKGKEMATLTVEDYSSMTEITLFDKAYESVKDQLDYCSILYFKYKATTDGDFTRVRPGPITIIKGK